jgi:hypothetical protein
VRTGINLVHVTYKGNPTIPGVIELMSQGKLRGLDRSKTKISCSTPDNTAVHVRPARARRFRPVRITVAIEGRADSEWISFKRS